MNKQNRETRWASQSWEPIDLTTVTLPPRARVRNERIACDSCDGIADTVHLIPWCVEVEQVKVACPRHDPGGYWVSLDRLRNPEDFASFIFHLAQKGRGDGVVALLRYLAPAQAVLHAPPPAPDAEARAFLREFLGDGVKRTRREVEDAARERGLAWRAVERAAHALGVVHVRPPGRIEPGAERRWWLMLADT